MDNFVNGFSKGIAKINLKTTNMLEENKLKTYISTLQGEIAAIQAKLGEEVYKQWTKGNVDVESLLPDLSKIQENERVIEEQKRKIEEINEQERKILGAGEAGTPAGVPAKRFCGNCGNEVPATHKFCVKCGTPVE